MVLEVPMALPVMYLSPCRFGFLGLSFPKSQVRNGPDRPVEALEFWDFGSGHTANQANG